ncbi:unnamed protein product [Zymoseptoria tritici ST99CH_3D7]|uniref:Cytochrome P450 alkane hydroxylase n=1 Tax=Zymoseptoria tritici (strain ST99CH_3D7) TaxID=1276538 RepID=A0A1X7S2C3_ZYMT9|nr:unnamed protein product [Zymoseptoria tritici ST99CH_3D7]
MAFATLLLTIAAAAIAYFAFSFSRQRAINHVDLTYAQTHHCQPAPVLEAMNSSLGLGLLLRTFRVAKEQRLLHFFNDLVRSTGIWTFEQRLLGISGIDTFEPGNVEAVLSTQFEDFDLGERRKVFFALLGDGIFTQDGAAWAHTRALLRPAFYQQNTDRMLDEIDGLVGKMLRDVPEGEEVDFQPLFFRLTLETTMSLLFGKRMEGEDEQRKKLEMDDFAAAFDEAQDWLARRGRLGGLYWLIDGPGFWRSCRTVHRFIDAAIEEALRVKNVNEGETEGYSVLGALLPETQDRKVLREQCLNVLLAGRDTTACLLSWTCRLLASHPQTLTTLRQEITQICGTDPSPPSRAQLKRMRYLDAILKEVLRLYPSVPINSRTASRTTTLPTGGGPDRTSPILIRKGQAVAYSPYIMHRREDIFGPDAAAFRPERWLENDGWLFAEAGWAYLPFNGGRRVCLGQEFALLEAGSVIVGMVRRWTAWKVAGDGEAFPEVGMERQKVTLVVSCAEGCRLEVKS